MMDKLTKWLNDGTVGGTLEATRNRAVRKEMIAGAKHMAFDDEHDEKDIEDDNNNDNEQEQEYITQ